MDTHQLDLKVIALILTVGFAFASFLGYLSNRFHMSPVLGYLVAGYFIGPFSPGFVADEPLTEQLAEIGVILMMFGVGIKFTWENLDRVKYLAIPGAIGQIIIATLAGVMLLHPLGYSWGIGFLIGFSISVASTVVLVKVLSDFNILHTPSGHIAMGWLIIEDMITVLALLLVPSIAIIMHGGHFSLGSIAGTIVFSLFKFGLLVLLSFTIGTKLITYTISKVVSTSSKELFTLTILAITFVIAMGASIFFGVSVALGAFIAGMVIGQTDVHHRVSKNMQPLRDTFIVIFFLTVGMLFNPYAIKEHFLLFLSSLVIVLLLKPLTAYFITLGAGKPKKTAIMIGLALAQIGEFTFIFAEQALNYNIFPDEGYDVLVACSLISIAINPLLFKFFKVAKS